MIYPYEDVRADDVIVCPDGVVRIVVKLTDYGHIICFNMNGFSSQTYSAIDFITKYVVVIARNYPLRKESESGDSVAQK